VYSLLVTLGLFLLLRLLGSAYARMARAIESWPGKVAPAWKPQSGLFNLDTQIAAALLTLLRLCRVVILLLLLYLFPAIVFGFFPWTQGYEAVLVAYVEARLHAAGSAFVTKLPDLLFIGIIIVVTYYIIKGIRFFFDEIERGAISVSGFDREWATATYK